jgi:hypothetical protein
MYFEWDNCWKLIRSPDIDNKGENRHGGGYSLGHSDWARMSMLFSVKKLPGTYLST